MYGHEEMLVGSEERNQAIVNAQIERNGGLNDGQTNDLINMIKWANDWLCRTDRQHMLGGFDMIGLHVGVGTDIGFAAPLAEQQQQPMPVAVENETSAPSQTDNDDELEKRHE